MSLNGSRLGFVGRGWRFLSIQVGYQAARKL